MPKGIYERNENHREQLRINVKFAHERTRGKPQTEEHRKKISNGQFKERSKFWKGEGAGYVQKHVWIHRNIGKANKCENTNCKFPDPKRYEWANVSKEYKRDMDDWIQLCINCHRIYERKLNGKTSSTNKSGFHGVSFCKQLNKWQTSIQHCGIDKHLGYYDTPEEASDVYQTKILELYKDFNIPNKHLSA